LTKNSPHIPYRDSKLTRLLKESLGGNNKTSLIVACSAHHSNYDETISSLRFAQSAKHIQNKVKINIKTSNEQLKIIIVQLKNELRTAHEEIHRLRTTHSYAISGKEEEMPACEMIKDPNNNQSVLGGTPLQAIHNRPH